MFCVSVAMGLECIGRLMRLVSSKPPSQGPAECRMVPNNPLSCGEILGHRLAFRRVPVGPRSVSWLVSFLGVNRCGWSGRQISRRRVDPGLRSWRRVLA